ncbi:MAG TPA: response regulator [Steroidobacteraceae bacterium]|nr:response regulator [Steroidobacteraceae bacterium]
MRSPIVKASGRSRVLVIDDNHDAADSCRMLLEQDGHEVEVAYTAKQGLESGDRVRPDVVLLDIGYRISMGMKWRGACGRRRGAGIRRSWQ